MRSSAAVFGSCLLLLAACPPGTGDGGPPLEDGGSSWEDGGLADAGLAPSDAGLLDAGLVDAGLVDAGLVDAGLVDSGLVDAGLVDAGLVDAGLVDAGLVDAGLVDDGGPPSPGTFDSPILVDDFPFAFAGDTTMAPSDLANAYAPCAPSIPEEGGEYVFEVRIPADDGDRELVVAVDDVAGDLVDIDLHLLSAPSPEACLARDHTELRRIVSPGEVLYVAADTWTHATGVDLAGPFTLTLALADVDVEACLVNPIPTCDETSFPTPNGVPVEPPGLGGCPPGMALVDSFCVDRYEAALVEVLAGGELAAFSPYANPGSTTVRAVSAPGLVPQGYISGVQAGAACAEAGKRLCSDAEWLRACRGPTMTTYPYGDALQAGVCNDDRVCHPAVQYFETTESWIWSELGHPCIGQLPATASETGEHSGCVSTESIYDLMGNLHEWTADPAGTFRGGFYADTAINGPGCLYVTTAHTTAHWDYSTGFRCCADLP